MKRGFYAFRTTRGKKCRSRADTFIRLFPGGFRRNRRRRPGFVELQTEVAGMSSEMYSTNPSFIGGAAIVAAGWMASRPLAPGASTGVAPYFLVGFGYLCYVLALSTTADVGLSGVLRFCAGM